MYTTIEIPNNKVNIEEFDDDEEFFNMHGLDEHIFEYAHVESLF